MKYFLLTILVAAASAFGITAETAKSSLKLSDIKTDSVKTAPAGTSQNRAWFVEAVQ